MGLTSQTSILLNNMDHEHQKYLSTEDLKFDIKVDFKPLSTDTYNEQAVKEAVLKAGVRECYIVAVQWACIGMGNKSLGNYQDADGVTKSVKDLMDNLGINYKAHLNSKLEPGELTPKRLARVFRRMLSEHIHDHVIPPSFLWYKYNRDCDPSLCFPGAEYLVLGDAANDLIKTYEEVDRVRGTKFAERIRRIIEVRVAKVEKA